MKTLERTVYQCDHCGKNYFMRYAAERHEKYCMQNPANKHACFDCKFLSVDRVQSDEGYYEKTFHCEKLALDLHSAIAERMNHSCLQYTERMPLSCSEHKSAYDYDELF
jgi:ribosomal protein L37AE/L43A